MKVGDLVLHKVYKRVLSEKMDSDIVVIEGWGNECDYISKHNCRVVETREDGITIWERIPTCIT